MSRPRVALMSVGLGRVQRGFERYFQDIFGVLGDGLEVTLFKSGGAQDHRNRVPPMLHAVTRLTRTLPLGRFAGRTEYHRDCLAFGLCVLPQVMGRRFDVIHCIDPPLAVVLGWFRRLGLISAPLLFTEGSVMPPRFYPRVDHIHHVAQAAYDEAIACGVPASRMSLVPCGLHTQRFHTTETRARLRAQFEIPESRFVILAVSALKREHKRVDYIIEEASQVPGDVMLWLDGYLEDPSIPELARACMGERCRITHVSSAEVPALYGAADVFVHAALEESFGLALVEALCSGLAVIAHDSPHFRWLIGDPSSLIDMAEPGALTRRLTTLLATTARRADPAVVETTRKRFDWGSLRADYSDLYQRVAGVDGS